MNIAVAVLERGGGQERLQFPVATVLVRMRQRATATVAVWCSHVEPGVVLLGRLQTDCEHLAVSLSGRRLVLNRFMLFLSQLSL